MPPSADAALYDEVAYPSATFLQTHPNRLAVLARLHGLDTADVETARVLDLGGGDGLNVIAMAVAWPHAHFLNVDLAAGAVARGNALIGRTGLSNVRCETGDILALRERFAPGSFDFVIAHGVYAWVSESVRDAILALIAHVLSPCGMAFVSFNALPGGHVRRIMREMVLDAIEGIDGHGARLAAVEAFLEAYRVPRDDDDGLSAFLRGQARSMLQRPRAALFHDELGPVFAPQALKHVVSAADAHGLEFLTDAGSNRSRDGLSTGVGADGSTAAVVRRLQAEDHLDFRYFRQIVLVRAGRNPARVPDLAAIRTLHAAGAFEDRGDGEWETAAGSFTLHDGALAPILTALTAHWPRYLPLADLGASDAQVAALLDLWHENLVFLSTTPERFALDLGDRPCASPLVRAQLELGMPNVCTLHHMPVGVEDPAARALLAACDGTRSRAQLAAIWDEVPHNPAVTLDIALDVLARQRLMMPAR